MKTIKKLLALTLVLCMVFCLSSAVFAVTKENGELVDESKITVTKKYTLTNPNTTSPEETFYLQQVGDVTVTESEATTGPALPKLTGEGETNYVAKAHFNEGGAGGSDVNFEINLPATGTNEGTEFTKVGVYTYKLKEVAGNTAGVTYYGEEFRLVVTVINDNNKLRIAVVHTEDDETEDKKDDITNAYSAGKLSISKTVSGNLADENKYFEFKVTLNGEQGKTYRDSYAVSGGSNSSNPTSIKIGEETSFQLKHGETISIANLPYNVTYTVTETAADGYVTKVGTTTTNTATGTISQAEQTAAFTNTREGTIDMGVTLDSLPYILALAVVFGGAVVMFTRKRHVED